MQGYRSVAQIAEITGKVPQRIYQLIDELKIERIPPGSRYFMIRVEDANRIEAHLRKTKLGRPKKNNSKFENKA